MHVLLQGHMKYRNGNNLLPESSVKSLVLQIQVTDKGKFWFFSSLEAVPCTQVTKLLRVLVWSCLIVEHFIPYLIKICLQSYWVSILRAVLYDVQLTENMKPKPHEDRQETEPNQTYEQVVNDKLVPH